MTDVFRSSRPAVAGRNATALAAFALSIVPGATSARAQTEPRVKWEICDDVANPSSGAECATTAMPLRHNTAAGPTIELALKRVPARGERRRQLWFLDGGPGDAATASVERLAAVLDDPELEVLTFDNRGTGGTALLECPDQQRADGPEGADLGRDEWPACVEHVVSTRRDLEALGTSEVIQDLHELIERFRLAGVPVFVMGASYGTYVVQRYLHSFPAQVDGIIMDGIVPLDWGFDEFDAGLDRIGRRLLARCADDVDCAAHLGADPVSRVEQLLDRQRQGHCYPLTLTPDVTRLVLGAGLMVDEIPPGILTAIVFRLNRCEWHDQMAVLHLFRNVFDEIREGPSHSPVLQRHVSMSELWSPDAPTADDLQDALDGYVMTTEVSASFAETVPAWPTYPRPENAGRFPEFAGPMLMMHGGLDPTMPAERLTALRTSYPGATQSFVVMPDHGHVVLNDSDCARDIYRQFLRNPAMSPDTSCVAQTAPLDFDVAPAVALRMFGTEDLWGDRPSMLQAVFFLGLYRSAALGIGALGLIMGIIAWRRASAFPPSPLRLALSALGWIVAVVIVWQGLFFLPYVLPYRAAGTVAVGVAGLAVQGLFARWLISRLDRARSVPG